ncbi:GNAT family N-acetyltransferase [Amycolatopsis sp. EV170708-02-1]|uniref:GNAT family N-acetyltransferase n=1 Tax=Amycolatopsis sp. EV170708-02-1 TaxID=2919322 RepID=UPI001F0C48FC|nr:GNAT family N-acetyltransferase [Amycolatopsis sp. EV170708-02-1]UMP07030.1 GNAT family N-acetyltransferase [Amycolatopsis sp. EV170708-02-1]
MVSEVTNMIGQDHDASDANVPGVNGKHAVHVRLIRPGEGAAAVAVAAAAGAPGTFSGSPLEAALDQFGGYVPFADLRGAHGWCFGAFSDDRLVGVVYACSPVNFIRSFRPEHHAHLIQTLIEIEILAVDDGSRGCGAGTALLSHAEQHFRELGLQLIVAKIDATDKQVMLWYRHRGYTLARNGESCFINTPEGPAGINAGPVDGEWRLAAKAPHASIVRRTSGLWLNRVDGQAS